MKKGAKRFAGKIAYSPPSQNKMLRRQTHDFSGVCLLKFFIQAPHPFLLVGKRSISMIIS